MKRTEKGYYLVYTVNIPSRRIFKTERKARFMEISRNTGLIAPPVCVLIFAAYIWFDENIWLMWLTIISSLAFFVFGVYAGLVRQVTAGMVYEEETDGAIISMEEYDRRQREKAEQEKAASEEPEDSKGDAAAEPAGVPVSKGDPGPH